MPSYEDAIDLRKLWHRPGLSLVYVILPDGAADQVADQSACEFPLEILLTSTFRFKFGIPTGKKPRKTTQKIPTKRLLLNLRRESRDERFCILSQRNLIWLDCAEF